MEREISPPPSKRRKISSLIHGATNFTEPLRNVHIPYPADSEDETIILIYSWNINGIFPFLQRSISSYFSPQSKNRVNSPTVDDNNAHTTASLRSFLHRHKWPHILCLQEVKIANSDNKTQAAVKKAVNAREFPDDNGPKYEVFFTLPRDKFNARGWGGKVYGVCSIIHSGFYSSHVKRVRDVNWDLEGRFSIIEIQDPESSKKLAVWNVYAVNGTTNEYRDSKTGTPCGNRHSRKLAIHRLMMDECKTMEAQGWNVVIIGDLNIAPARIDGFPNLRTWPEQHLANRTDFNKRFLDTGNEDGFKGVDVWRYLRGDERKYTYYPRNREWGSSCDRVDLVVSSNRLVADRGIVDAEIWSTEKERGPSDHVPLSVHVRLVDEKHKRLKEEA